MPETSFKAGDIVVPNAKTRARLIEDWTTETGSILRAMEFVAPKPVEAVQSNYLILRYSPLYRQFSPGYHTYDMPFDMMEKYKPEDTDKSFSMEKFVNSISKEEFAKFFSIIERQALLIGGMDSSVR